MTTPRTSTPTLIAAMRALARDIDSPDGVANAAILEAAERMDEMRSLMINADFTEMSEWFQAAVKEAIE
jgi:hypothetical protein